MWNVTYHYLADQLGDLESLLQSCELRLICGDSYGGMDDGHEWWFGKEIRRIVNALSHTKLTGMAKLQCPRAYRCVAWELFRRARHTFQDSWNKDDIATKYGLFVGKSDSSTESSWSSQEEEEIASRLVDVLDLCGVDNTTIRSKAANLFHGCSYMVLTKVEFALHNLGMGTSDWDQFCVDSTRSGSSRKSEDEAVSVYDDLEYYRAVVRLVNTHFARDAILEQALRRDRFLMESSYSWDDCLHPSR